MGWLRRWETFRNWVNFVFRSLQTGTTTCSRRGASFDAELTAVSERERRPSSRWSCVVHLTLLWAPLSSFVGAMPKFDMSTFAAFKNEAVKHWQEQNWVCSLCTPAVCTSSPRFFIWFYFISLPLHVSVIRPSSRWNTQYTIWKNLDKHLGRLGSDSRAERRQLQTNTLVEFVTHGKILE
jgi:hypothetical protein